MCRKKHSITSQPVKAIPELIVKSRKINSPAIIYSRKVLNDNLNIFLSSLKTVNNKVHLLYAVKACTNSEVIREMATKVTGFSVSSDEEYNLVQRYNKVISATGFGYRRYPQNDRNCIFYFNSLSQLQCYLNNKDNYIAAKIGIRIRSPKTLFSKSVTSSRFGFTLKQIKLLKDLKKIYNFEVSSILIHQENKVFDDVNELKCFIAKILRKSEFQTVNSINLGGGWDNLFLKKQISKFINNLEIPKQYDIYIEPGSALVRTIGILKATVIDESIEDNIRTITLNTSQFNNSSWYVPKIVAYKKEGLKKLDTYVYGNTCYEKDYFGKYTSTLISLNSDVIMYPVGAYYFTTHRELHGLSFPKEYCRKLQ